jgi:hypothetical protein
MNPEQLISKKVKHKFDQKSKQVLFDVISLEDHFDGLLIHTSDIIYIEEGELVNGYVKVGDVNFDSAVSKEFVEEDSTLNHDLIAKHATSFSWKDGIVDSETIYQGGMENPFEWKDGIVDSEAVMKIEVTAETLNDNPELAEAGIKVGETISVDNRNDVEAILDKLSLVTGDETILKEGIQIHPIEEVIPAKDVKKKTSTKK